MVVLFMRGVYSLWYLSHKSLTCICVYSWTRLREYSNGQVMRLSGSCPGLCGRRWECHCLESTSSLTTRPGSTLSLTSTPSQVSIGAG